jgi:hypothetical protein
MGIRSVLINGQRFYQPVDVTPEGSSLSEHAFPDGHQQHWRNGDYVQMPVLTTAVKVLEGNRTCPGNGGNRQREGNPIPANTQFASPALSMPTEVMKKADEGYSLANSSFNSRRMNGGGDIPKVK